jgi:hypothetical protein
MKHLPYGAGYLRPALLLENNRTKTRREQVGVQ